MVISIARQSVLIKCNMQASIMLGNYEFYYAAGLFFKILGEQIEQGIKPEDLYQMMEPKLESFETQDEKERYLIKLLKDYKPLQEYDKQMEELLYMGLTEEQMWQVQI